MSEERERFPIQPDERRMSAKSSDGVQQAPEEARPAEEEARPAGGADSGGPEQDRPDYPPHERHERRE